MQTRSITTQISEAPVSNQTGIIFRTTSNNIDFATIINFVVFSTIAAIAYIYISARQQSASNSKPSDEMPCYRCRYFNNNLYLKCALHPTNVLTEGSIDCVSYHSKDRSIAEKLFSRQHNQK